MGASDIPSGWRLVSLRDVARVETGGTPSRSRPEFWRGPINWMSSGEVHQRAVRHTQESITEAGLSSSNAKVFPPGTVMVALNGQGRTRGMTAMLETAAACNQSLAAISPKEGVSGRFLFQSLDARYRQLRALTGSAARNGLNLGHIRSLPLLLPPLGEQLRIAEALEAIDLSIEKTEAVIDASERVRRALASDLLSKGVSAWHTAWREVPGVGTMPVCWEVARLGAHLAEGPTNGLYKPEADYGTGTWMIRITDFTWGVLERTEGFDRVRVTPQELAAFSVSEGDVLVNRVNSLSHLGKCALVPKLNEPAVYESNMMRIRTTQSLLPEFLLAVLCSDVARRHFVARAKKAVAQCSINQSDVKQLVMPLPPRAEQEMICRLLEGVTSRLEGERQALEALRRFKVGACGGLLSGSVRLCEPQEVKPRWPGR